jgi:hypothetical protein
MEGRIAANHKGWWCEEVWGVVAHTAVSMLHAHLDLDESPVAYVC